MLPTPSPEALAHSQRVIAHLRQLIEAEGGWIPFSRYMETVLYAPGLGYYAAGADMVAALLEVVSTAHPSFFDGEIRPMFQRILDELQRYEQKGGR
jgi:SAM-dependent MidA family methyltransferase